MDNVIQGLILALLAAAASFVFFLVLAPSRIYERDQLTIANIRQELKNKDDDFAAQLDARKPDLRAKLLGVAVGHMEGHDELEVIWTFVRIHNIGAASTVHAWRLVFRDKDGREVVGMPIMSSQPELHVTSELFAAMKFSKENWLADKASREPIKRDDVITGYLIFAVQGYKPEELYKIPPPNYTLTFEDILGRRLTVQNNVTSRPFQGGPNVIVPDLGGELLLPANESDGSNAASSSAAAKGDSH